MKKILFIIAIAFCSLSAIANEPGVDPRVLESFKTEFASAREVKWTTTSDFYKADFTFNDQQVSAYYSKEGELIGLSRHITSFDLPLSLQAGLKKSYNSYWISDLVELTKSNSTIYYITLEDADTQLILKAGDGESWNEYKRTKKI